MSPFINNATSIISNLSSILHRIKRHDDFLTDVDEKDCVVDNVDFAKRCSYLHRTISCFEKMELIDYITFLHCYCSGQPAFFILGFIVVILWTLYLFLTLSVAADMFFCPALTVLSKAMKMTESLAGVTLLAFGNGAPDLFTALANPHGDTELMYNELFGGSAFIIAVIGGTIILVRQFKLEPFKIARDCFFFMLASMFIGYAIHDNVFKITECLIVILLYLAYLIVVIIDRFLDKNPAVIEMKISEPDENAEESDSLIKQFFKGINPLDLDEWRESGTFGKIILILQIPIVFIMKLIIPIVDYEAERHGWNKLLNILHCIILPQYLLLVTKLITFMIYGVPLSIILLVVSLIPVLLLIFLTNKDKPPKFHILLCIGTLVGAILSIYLIAQEIVAVLSVIGETTGLSHSILGITLLSWGNCVGDLVSNVMLAKQGHARMGFFGCFGGAMFNCLTGVGVTFVLRLSEAPDHVAYGRSGGMGPNCTIFLFLLLGFLFFAFAMTNFWARRAIGVYMICIYCLFTIFCILNEFEIVHPLGTDHSDQLHIWYGEFVSGSSL